MSQDRDTARRALDLQARSREFRILDIPGYTAWSKQKLAAGQSEALIAHLDCMTMWLLPEEVEEITEREFEEMLDDLKATSEDDAGKV